VVRERDTKKSQTCWSLKNPAMVLATASVSVPRKRRNAWSDPAEGLGARLRLGGEIISGSIICLTNLKGAGRIWVLGRGRGGRNESDGL